MKQAGCRHLPVVEGDRLVGMVSQRDLLQIDLTEKDEEIRWLNAYIHFIPPGEEGTRSPGLPRSGVVLVRPETAGEHRRRARASSATPALPGLDLVAPGDWRTVECWRTAWGAQEVLEEARVFATSRPRVGGRDLRGRALGPAGIRRARARRAGDGARGRGARPGRRGRPRLRARDIGPDAGRAGALRPRACASPPSRPAVAEPVPRGHGRGLRGVPRRPARAPPRRGAPRTTRRSAARRCCAGPAGHRALPAANTRRATSRSGGRSSSAPTSRPQEVACSSTWRARWSRRAARRRPEAMADEQRRSRTCRDEATGSRCPS